jgi:hypothetical protein
MRRPSVLSAASGIVMFYPGRLLANQVNDWAERHGGCRTAVSYERTLPGIRKRLRRSAFALIDATIDPSQASDAFLQAIGVLRADSVAVYTEHMHQGLETLVRVLGAPLLLGPMAMEELEDFLEHKFPTLIPLASTSENYYSDRHGYPLGSEDDEGENIVHYRPIAG